MHELPCPLRVKCSRAALVTNKLLVSYVTYIRTYVSRYEEIARELHMHVYSLRANYSRVTQFSSLPTSGMHDANIISLTKSTDLVTANIYISLRMNLKSLGLPLFFQVLRKRLTRYNSNTDSIIFTRYFLGWSLQHVLAEMADSQIVSTLNWDKGKYF